MTPSPVHAVDERHCMPLAFHNDLFVCLFFWDCGCSKLGKRQEPKMLNRVTGRGLSPQQERPVTYGRSVPQGLLKPWLVARCVFPGGLTPAAGEFTVMRSASPSFVCADD